MPKNRAPPEPADGNEAGGVASTKPETTKGKEKIARARSHSTLPREEDLAASKARRERYASVRVWRNSKMLMYVFVGGLSTETTVDGIKQHFRKCSPFGEIIIRQSVYSGQGPFSNYASVEFLRPDAYRFALDLNGTMLDGRKITVGLSALDMPDSLCIEEKFTRYIQDIDQTTSQQVRKALRRVPTEIIEDDPQPPAPVQGSSASSSRLSTPTPSMRPNQRPVDTKSIPRGPQAGASGTRVKVLGFRNNKM